LSYYKRILLWNNQEI